MRHNPNVHGEDDTFHRKNTGKLSYGYRRTHAPERARKQYGAVIQRRLELERLSASLSSRMLKAGSGNADRAERIVREVLSDIGIAFDADYCFLHLLSSDRKIIERGYEWHVEGLASISERLIGQPGSAFPYMAAEFDARSELDPASVYLFPDLMPEPDEVKALLQHLGIQAVALVPLYIDSHLIGYFGLRSCRSDPRWPAADLRQLKLMGELIANTLLAVSAADRLVNERNMLQSLIDTVPHHLYAKDTAGRTIAINRACAALFGRIPDEALGLTDQDVYNDAEAQAYYTDEQKVIETGIPLLGHEETVRDSAGCLLWFSTTKTPLRDERGKIVGIVGMGRDITEQKAITAALHENLNRFRVLFEGATEGIAIFRVVYDAAGNAVNYEFVDINKHFERIQQIQRDACIGRTITEALGLTSPPYLKEYAAVAVTGIPYRIEHYNPLLSKHLYVSVFQMSPGYFATLVVDITATKQAEAELREAEARYRNSFENATLGVFRSTPDGRYLLVNSAMAKIYGYDTPQEMRDLAGADIPNRTYGNPGERTDFTRILERAGTVSNFEAQHRRKDGSMIWARFSLRTTWDAPGVPQYYDGIVEDITVRKETERALQERESQFRFLAENMHDVIWTMNNNRQFTYISPSIQLLRGLEPAAAMREGYLDAFTPVSRNIVRNAIAQRAEAEASGKMDSVFYLELQQYHRNGTLLWVELLMQALLDAQGRRIGFLGIVRDITARKLAEEKLQYASTHDVLTGQYNRAFFQNELFRLCREGTFPFSVILADVNGLKHTNDLRGHAAGDELIRRAVQVLVKGCRSDAVVARYGGDEFAVLLPETGAVAARATVLLVQSEILSHNATGARSTGANVAFADPGLSLAIGVATATGPMNADKIMSIVDARMYENKRTSKL